MSHGITRSHGLTRGVLATASAAALAFGLASAPVAHAELDVSFKRVSTTAAYLNASKADVAVSEISTVSPDGKTLYYTDAGGKRVGRMDITDPNNPKPLGTVAVGGEPTSVYAYEGYVLVVVDSTDGNFKNPSGHVSVLDASTLAEVQRIDLGGQPDSIDISGHQAVIAIENQRDEDAKNDRGEGKKGDLPQSPAGELAMINLAGLPKTWKVEKISLVGLPGLVEASDPEPEYVKFSPDGSKIAVTLQENNAVVVLDAKSHKVLSSWSAGVTLVHDTDTAKDGQIILNGTTVEARREPDSIGWVDNNHVATANEGDWKGGTRGWTIFQAMTGLEVWDAGNSFEYQAIANGHWDDSRAAKKGTEPEGLAVATYNGVRYAFVGSERSNFVAVYDLSNPAKPVYKQMLPTTNGPEGILPIPGRNLLAVSSEVDEPGTPVRATIGLYQLSGGAPVYPYITSLNDGGKPLPWLALGALAASDEAHKLYSASDTALQPNRIYTIETDEKPAIITKALPVTKDGKPTTYDIEGLHAVKGGKDGFWLGAEGDGKKLPNQIVRVDAKGQVVEEISLPADIAASLGKWGIEGITGDPEGKALYIALQRDLDASKPTRIVRYDLTTRTWTSFGYELEKTDVEGDWMGLSEIVYVGQDAQGGARLAVIERDKMAGPDARIKRIYQVTVAADQKAGDMLAKKLVHDVLPDLQATKGWTQEKLEGMTIAANGDVYIVTDNDGLKDNNGETVFLNLGKLFKGSEPAEPGTPDPSTPAPSSPAPSSPAPSSEAPSSPAPSSSAPSSEAPTSQAPTSEAPSTSAPTSEQPITGPKPPKLPDTGR